MYNGEVMSATASGQLTQLILASHNFIQASAIERESSVIEATFKKQLALHKYIIAKQYHFNFSLHFSLQI